MPLAPCFCPGVAAAEESDDEQSRDDLELLMTHLVCVADGVMILLLLLPAERKGDTATVRKPVETQ